MVDQARIVALQLEEQNRLLSERGYMTTLMYNIPLEEEVISIDSLKEEIAKQKKENEAEIVRKWQSLLTAEYIKKKIIAAESKGQQYTILFEDLNHPNPVYLRELFITSGTKAQLLSILDNDTITVYTIYKSYFEMGIQWENKEEKDSKICCILL